MSKVPITISDTRACRKVNWRWVGPIIAGFVAFDARKLDQPYIVILRDTFLYMVAPVDPANSHLSHADVHR